MSRLLSILVFIRLLVQYRRQFIGGHTEAQAVGYPSNSRRALASCCWTTAVYLGRWSGLWDVLRRGDRCLWEGYP